jgi:hypothetical protein
MPAPLTADFYPSDDDRRDPIGGDDTEQVRHQTREEGLALMVLVLAGRER